MSLKKIIYDASVLVSGNVSGNIHRTGLYRVSYEVLKELVKSNEFELFLFDIFQREREIKKYVQKDFPQCKRIKIYSCGYRLFVFPLGNLADNFREIQLSNSNKIISFSAGLLKNIFLLTERTARKLERIFLIEKKIKRSFNNCSVYYSTYFPIPEQVRLNPKIKKVYTAHDLIAIFHPEYFSSPYNQILVKEVIDNIGINDYMIAVSESTKRDILKYRPDIHPKNIVVAPLAASYVFNRESDNIKIEQTKNKYNLKCDKYILSLCTLEPRKNLKFLVDVYKTLLKDLPGFDLKLVLIGSYGWGSSDLLDEIKEINQIHPNAIKLLGYVPDEDISALYSAAFVFVYPSLYEGFGLPVLEAMQCGVPVICSNTSSLPEVIGDCGIMIDPTKAEELKLAFMTLKNDSILYQTLSRKSIERSKKFHWKYTTMKIAELFRS